jgi:hypothetical protein
MAEEVRKPDHEASNPRDEISNMTTKKATPFASTQDSNPCTARAPSQTEEMDAFKEDRTEAIESRSATDRGLVGPQQQRRLGHCSKGHSKIHNFYTKASILSPRGIFDLERVQVDERSSFNLLPLSIAMGLDLILYSDRVLTITVADRLILTNQYCRFTIRVAGVDTTINTGVISGLQTVLLGQEWIQSVNLLSGFGNQSYYIPIPLAVEAAEERFPGVGDGEVEAQDIELVKMAMTDEIGKEDDGGDCGNIVCGDDSSSDGELSPCELSPNDEHSLDDDPLSDGELSSGELSCDVRSSLDGDFSGDELSLDDDYSSNAEISSSEELNSDEHDLAPADEDDKVYEDDEDYEDYEGKKCSGCEEYEEYEEYEEFEEGQECQECQKGEDDTDANLQDFMEQHKHLEYYAEPQRTKAACEIAKLEPEQKLHHLTSVKNPSARNDEPVGDQAFNMGTQQSEPKGERVSTTTVFKPCW